MRIDKQARDVRLGNLLYMKPVTTPRPASVLMETVKRVLALDPGTKNCGCAVVEITLRYHFDQKHGTFHYVSHDWKIIHLGTIENTITDMTQLYGQSLAFYREIRALSEQHKVDALAAERFQARGFKGTTIECVNAMIGILSCMPAVYYSLPGRFTEWTREMKQKPMQLKAITAAQWKNDFNRTSDLDRVYASAHTLGISTHKVDAAGIAVYCIRKTLIRRFQLDNDLRWLSIKTITEYKETL